MLSGDETKIDDKYLKFLEKTNATDEEPSLAYYRIYSLDVRDAHIIDVDYFEADGDAAAILKVGAGATGVSRELWSLGRKVMDFIQ